MIDELTDQGEIPSLPGIPHRARGERTSHSFDATVRVSVLSILFPHTISLRDKARQFISRPDRTSGLVILSGIQFVNAWSCGKDDLVVSEGQK